MDQNRLKFGISIKAVVINNDGKILICKAENGIWDLPGGRMQEGEDIKDCLKREVREELGVDCELLDNRPLFVWQGLSDAGEPKVAIGFKTKLMSLNFKPSDENIENRFFGKNDFDGIKLQNSTVNLRDWLKN